VWGKFNYSFDIRLEGDYVIAVGGTPIEAAGASRVGGTGGGGGGGGDGGHDMYPLPLKCVWRRRLGSTAVVMDVTSNVYQLSADDMGACIQVEAQPADADDREFHGTAVGEIGPFDIPTSTKTAILNAVGRGGTVMPIIIDSEASSPSPCRGMLKLPCRSDAVAKRQMRQVGAAGSPGGGPTTTLTQTRNARLLIGREHVTVQTTGSGDGEHTTLYRCHYDATSPQIVLHPKDPRKFKLIIAVVAGDEDEMGPREASSGLDVQDQDLSSVTLCCRSLSRNHRDLIALTIRCFQASVHLETNCLLERLLQPGSTQPASGVEHKASGPALPSHSATRGKPTAGVDGVSRSSASSALVAPLATSSSQLLSGIDSGWRGLQVYATGALGRLEHLAKRDTGGNGNASTEGRRAAGAGGDHHGDRADGGWSGLHLPFALPFVTSPLLSASGASGAATACERQLALVRQEQDLGIILAAQVARLHAELGSAVACSSGVQVRLRQTEREKALLEEEMEATIAAYQTQLRDMNTARPTDQDAPQGTQTPGSFSVGASTQTDASLRPPVVSTVVSSIAAAATQTEGGEGQSTDSSLQQELRRLKQDKYDQAQKIKSLQHCLAMRQQQQQQRTNLDRHSQPIGTRPPPKDRAQVADSASPSVPRLPPTALPQTSGDNGVQAHCNGEPQPQARREQQATHPQATASHGDRTGCEAKEAYEDLVSERNRLTKKVESLSKDLERVRHQHEAALERQLTANTRLIEEKERIEAEAKQISKLYQDMIEQMRVVGPGAPPAGPASSASDDATSLPSPHAEVASFEESNKGPDALEGQAVAEATGTAGAVGVGEAGSGQSSPLVSVGPGHPGPGLDGRQQMQHLTMTITNLTTQLNKLEVENSTLKRRLNKFLASPTPNQASDNKQGDHMGI